VTAKTGAERSRLYRQRQRERATAAASGPVETVIKGTSFRTGMTAEEYRRRFYDGDERPPGRCIRRRTGVLADMEP
jgi:hypothetical protein